MQKVQVLPHWLVSAYQRLARVLVLDVSYVLLRAAPGETHGDDPAEEPAKGCANDHAKLRASDNTSRERENLRCQLLDADDLIAAARDRRFSITNVTRETMTEPSHRAIGAFDGTDLVGVCFFATGHVDPKHNRAGEHFHGIGLRCPESVCYQYKVFVLPEYRNQGINPQMIDFALTTYANSPVDTIVTTTDITNTGFFASVTKRGFEPVAIAAEWVLFKKSFYWMPKHLSLNQDRNPGQDQIQNRDRSQSIELFGQT